MICSVMFFMGVLYVSISSVRKLSETELRGTSTIDVVKDYQNIFMTAGVAAVVFMLMRGEDIPFLLSGKVTISILAP